MMTILGASTMSAAPKTKKANSTQPKYEMAQKLPVHPVMTANPSANCNCRTCAELRASNPAHKAEMTRNDSKKHPKAPAMKNSIKGNAKIKGGRR